MKKYKLAILASHPIQYQVPLFKKLANNSQIDLMVYFCSDYGIREKKDKEFGVSFKWDIPLLDGYKYKFLKNYGFKSNFPFLSQINLEIFKELKKNKFSAIIVQSWMNITSWIVFLNRTPIFLRTESPFSHEPLKAKWKIILKNIILRYPFNKTKAFLFIGEENRRFYQSYGIPEDKLFFTPYAVDNERFLMNFNELKSKKNELKKELNINSEKIVILFCGKLIDKKRPLDLLFAYEKIQFPNKCIIYVGDGYLRENIEIYTRKKNLQSVYLVGFKNQTELSKYYVLGDIFVLPSGLGETWGLVVNEAMCFELPIIVSDLVGCSSDILKHGQNGYIFPFGDIDKLAFYLEDLVISKEKREKYGERSIDIIQNYSYEKDIEGIINALEYISNDKLFKNQ